MKAALAVSPAYRPRLIVLDEPFGGLDVLVREQLIESIVDCTPEATILLASHDLTEIESFATHVAYLNEGRLEFVEETEALSARFREIEVTLEVPSDLPPGLPAIWIDPELAGAMVRFTDTRYEPTRSRDEVTRRFDGVREIQSREMSFRSIFLALAKSRRAQCRLVKTFKCAEGSRSSMMDVEDEHNHMRAAFGLRYRIGQPGTPARE